jgi:RNA polymerase sporulation-specific sigma factor
MVKSRKEKRYHDARRAHFLYSHYTVSLVKVKFQSLFQSDGRNRGVFVPSYIPSISRKYFSYLSSNEEENEVRGKVEICGIDTAKLQTLNNDEMMELLRRSQAGDKEARDKLICGNLRLVLSVIQRFLGRGANADDLFQVGCIGLMKAIDHFDVDQCVRFSTYGVPMIVGEIRRYLRDNSSIRVSRSMRDTAYRVLQAREKLLATTQREPTVEQLSRYLDIPREDVVMAMDAMADPVSLYEPVYSDSGDSVCVMDQVKDRANTDDSWIEQISLKEAISHLSQRERSILAMRFHQGMTQMEVSAKIGISQAQVSRLEKSAIGCIKQAL